VRHGIYGDIASYRQSQEIQEKIGVNYDTKIPYRKRVQADTTQCVSAQNDYNVSNYDDACHSMDNQSGNKEYFIIGCG
jgi:hypothetical protein